MKFSATPIPIDTPIPVFPLAPRAAEVEMTLESILEVFWLCNRTDPVPVMLVSLMSALDFERILLRDAAPAPLTPTPAWLP